MTTAETEAKIDRTDWAPGPWDSEPDRLEFTHAGLPCLILRTQMGHLCGYVAVPPEHPLHGAEYGTETPILAKALERRLEQPVGENPGLMLLMGAMCGVVEARPDMVFRVHGGLTYSDACSGRICHVPKEGEPDNVWWFGFDCTHSGDFSPSYAREGIRVEGTYRTVDYVRRNCESLAEQLIEIAKETTP